MTEGEIKPPSGGSTGSCARMPRLVRVIGTAIHSPLGIRLNRSLEMTSAGRLPPCSCPLTGSKSTSQISPILGSGSLTIAVSIALIVWLFVLQTVVHCRIPKRQLILVVLPSPRISTQSVVVLLHLLPELVLFVFLDGFLHNLTDRFLFLPG